MQALKLTTSLFIFFFFACQAPNDLQPEFPVLSQESIKTHLEQLASDEFEGRKPGSKGEALTIAYIADKLKDAGVQPGNNGSFFQSVPLLDITGFPSETMEIKTAKGLMVLDRSKDFVAHTERVQKEIKLNDSELVFCGYGIVDEQTGWNDYAGLNMKGKTAVVLINDPGFGGEDDAFFKGNTMTYFGRWTYKYEEADRQGADGLIIIHEKTSAGYPWFVVESSWSGSQQGLDLGDKSSDCAIKGWITLDQAKALFENSGLDLGKQIRAARKPGFTPVPLSASVNVGLKNSYKKVDSKNVVGIIEGSKYPDEYIVYTAHWDHLGIGKVVENDSIYNGALDNASGTSTVLAIAEAYANADKRPERSVVFLFVTAEEQGLLGSKYYVENPIYPLEKTVCNLNMDGVNPAGRMKDLTIIGMGHSDMDEIAEKHAKKQGRYIKNEATPEKGYFFRSDHFMFAKEGVPALYAEGGYEHWDKGVEYAKTFLEEYTASRYHAPSDQYDPEEWNFDGMMQDGELYTQIGWDLSNSRRWPKWNASSEFKRKAEVKD